MKKHSIIMSITALVGMVTCLVGLCSISSNVEQALLLSYLFLAFGIMGAITLAKHKDIDKLISK